jgi:hypothetical protein
MSAMLTYTTWALLAADDHSLGDTPLTDNAVKLAFAGAGVVLGAVFSPSYTGSRRPSAAARRRAG